MQAVIRSNGVLSAEQERLRKLGITKFSGVRVRAVASFVPPTVLTNEEVAAQLLEDWSSWSSDPTNGEGDIAVRLTRGIGTDRRHVAGPEETCEDLMAEACRRALERSGVAPHEVDVCYASPNPPWFNTPPSHCIVADAIGLRSGVGGGTVNVACTGNVEAVRLALGDLTVGNARFVLVTGGNAMGPIAQRRLPFARASDRGIFGDGAGALLLERTPDGTGDWVVQRYDHPMHWWRIIHPFDDRAIVKAPVPDRVRSGFHMEGTREFFDGLAESLLMPCIRDFMAEVGIVEGGAIVRPPAVYLGHQPNWRLYEKTLRWLGLDAYRERAIDVYKEGADLISAELGIALDQAVERGQLHRGDSVLVFIYGSGLTQGNIAFTY